MLRLRMFRGSHHFLEELSCFFPLAASPSRLLPAGAGSEVAWGGLSAAFSDPAASSEVPGFAGMLEDGSAPFAFS